MGVEWANVEAFINLHSFGTTGMYGFSVVRLNGDVLEPVRTVYEEGILYEKTCIVGNYLYVACHSSGICVYNITDPVHPVKIGALTTGFTDASPIDGPSFPLCPNALAMAIVLPPSTDIPSNCSVKVMQAPGNS